MHDFFKKELDWWLKEEEKGEVEVWFSDESSFHLNPNSMYGWQEKTLETLKKVFLPANRARGANILGFMRTNNESEFYEFYQSMDADTFIACVNNFIEKRAKGQKILLILDRATSHSNHKVDKAIKKWKEKNVFIQFLPSYCSDLNYIEMLWKHIKHYWLDIAAWTNVKTLQKAVLDILAQFGKEKEYTINFAPS
ncbi:IS630 family transposase [Bernardetia sp. OM2101]|uniref:IS630 family transposase n=1 Tax=Bernardetia sp. OM2101 TaxID=3344876 RepID=UPI0035CF3050